MIQRGTEERWSMKSEGTEFQRKSWREDQRQRYMKKARPREKRPKEQERE